jgi:hypothetical protein
MSSHTVPATAVPTGRKRGRTKRCGKCAVCTDKRRRKREHASPLPSLPRLQSQNLRSSRRMRRRQRRTRTRRRKGLLISSSTKTTRYGTGAWSRRSMGHATAVSATVRVSCNIAHRRSSRAAAVRLAHQPPPPRRRHRRRGGGKGEGTKLSVTQHQAMGTSMQACPSSANVQEKKRRRRASNCILR